MTGFTVPDRPSAISPAEVLQSTLIDSRQRWRDLINLITDFAFETDKAGRFTLITPDLALGWSANTLVGQASDALLAEGGETEFNPFRVRASLRRRRVWLKRGDGGLACLAISAAPIKDGDGRITGTRGGGIDVTELDEQVAQAAMALRRSEVVDHVMARIAREVVAARMIEAALNSLLVILGAEGVAIVLGSTAATAARVAHGIGSGANSVLATVDRQLLLDNPGRIQTRADDRRPVLIAPWWTRSGDRIGLVAWRPADARDWDADDDQLMRTIVRIFGMLLEREAIQAEITHQARTDPLTGLLNRRAFVEEVGRHIARQDGDNASGTLMFADLDHFKAVNDLLGHDVGDKVLASTAALLRNTFRPTDLVARLGGDEFAVWLNGADANTVDDRAEDLRASLPSVVAEIIGLDVPRVTMSIGTARRDQGTREAFDSLMRRADQAMYEAKRRPGRQ